MIIPLHFFLTVGLLFSAIPLSWSGGAALHQRIAGEHVAPKETAYKNETADQRLELYNLVGHKTSVPWYWIAALDQYERSLSKARPKARPTLGQLSGIFMEESLWSGPLNPQEQDSNPLSIGWFGGIGRDGDGDGIADRSNDSDLLFSLTDFIASKGKRTSSKKKLSEDDLLHGLWEYYQNDRAVQRISQFAHIYAKLGYNKHDLFLHAFPLPVSSTYSYRSTWGTGRSWGGRRIHEGTDIFAGHGVPVRSTCYGIIEVQGWNRYGGWRIGIRDLNNHYHYYAHLSGFDKSIAEGDIVEPGKVIGWVGSSGYGPPGTQGKFPPHLHYGIYSDRGMVEWAFNPYPLLKQWEKADRKRGKKR